MKKAPHTVASKRDTMAPRKREKAFGRHRKDTENGLSPRGQSMLARSPSPTPEASHQAAVSDLKAHTAKRQGATRSAWGLPREKHCKVRRRNPLFRGRVLVSDTRAKGGNRFVATAGGSGEELPGTSSCNLGMSPRSDLTSNHRCCGQAP